MRKKKFKLSTTPALTSGDWDAFNVGAMCIADDAVVNADQVANLYIGASTNITIAATGTYTITVDLEAKTLLLTTTVGVEGVEVETAPAVYYNLQGIEVANPENGVYIVKRGNKVSKEIIRK